MKYINGKKVAEPGDIITCKGVSATIGMIHEQDYYLSGQKECWLIEFKDSNGKYRYWKSEFDGGTIHPQAA